MRLRRHHVSATRQHPADARARARATTRAPRHVEGVPRLHVHTIQPHVPDVDASTRSNNTRKRERFRTIHDATTIPSSLARLMRSEPQVLACASTERLRSGAAGLLPGTRGAHRARESVGVDAADGGGVLDRPLLRVAVLSRSASGAPRAWFIPRARGCRAFSKS